MDIFSFHKKLSEYCTLLYNYIVMYVRVHNIAHIVVFPSVSKILYINVTTDSTASCYVPAPASPSFLELAHRRKIRLIEGNAKYPHLKN